MKQQNTSLRTTIQGDYQYIFYNNIAILISTVSLFYNIIEGAVSIYFGEVTDSISLFFFGVQSFVEVLSSIIVLWKVMTSHAKDENQINKEKTATIVIGCLFLFLAVGILITGVLNLLHHDYPTTTIPNIIVSLIATIIMFVLWAIKKKLARELNSSTIQSDAQCSMACIKITTLLLIGSIIFHFWEKGWWIDAAMAIILGVLFGKEGVQMLRWASSKGFSGGCCGGCAKMPEDSKEASKKIADLTSISKKDYSPLLDEELDLEKGSCNKNNDTCCSGKKKNAGNLTTPLLEKDGCKSKNGNMDQEKDLTHKDDEVHSHSQNSNQSSLPRNIEAPILQKEKITEEKVDIESPEIPKKGGCCKAGKCSKKAVESPLDQERSTIIAS